MRRWLFVACVLAGLSAGASTVQLNQVFTLRTAAGSLRFNPERNDDLRRLQSQLDLVLQNPDDEEKHPRRGFEEIHRLIKKILADPASPERRQLEMDLVETALAVDNLDRPTAPPRIDLFNSPFAIHQFFRPVGIGRKPATNLAPGTEGDLSLRDPLPSSFWSRPANIAAEDLSLGFNRAAAPDVTNTLSHYSAAKESAGMNPGYEVEYAGRKVKLKFGEQHSEPAVTRFFWALGFHADPTDFAEGARVAYDRRIFTEFNSRRPVNTVFSFLWCIPVYTLRLQPHADPFDYIAAVVLRDGTHWTGQELKQHLLSGTQFQPAVEAQINYLVTIPANVQARDPRVKSIGPWDYAQLGHCDRREVRGAGLLAAWLGFYDARFDNTKLRLVGPKKTPRLEHFFSDLGAGLGRTKGLVFWHGEKVEEFPWRFTAPPQPARPGLPARPLRIVGYSPIVRNAAFAAMTIDDARWMARLIGQLTVPQMTQALEAAGYDPPTVRLYVRKLVSRRNYMMDDLGLRQEFPPLSPEVDLAENNAAVGGRVP